MAWNLHYFKPEDCMKASMKSSFAVAVGLVFLATVGCSNTSNQSSNPASADRTTAADRSAAVNMSSADKDFAVKAAQGGMAEVELGNLAQQKGASSKVKDYGKRLVDDHTKANNDLRDVAAREGISLPSDIDSSQRRTVDKLSKLSGAQFDREFLKQAVNDHKEDIDEFQKEAEKGTNPAVKEFASKYLPVLQDHLNMAEDAQKTVSGKK
jgi:putative membrane protein